ncbi:MAG: polyhydroxyalkanoate depolymerase [Candidatus Rickettsia vulgarisii]
MYNCNNRINNYYNMLELYRASLIPFRVSVEIAKDWVIHPKNPIHSTNLANLILSNLILAERVTRTYKKPKFNINECKINDKTYLIEEEVVLSKPFCQLRHFKKIGFKQKLPKLLIVAPMAGHHATLATDSIKSLLPYTDIYLTDWVDANLVPNEVGSFDLDDFIDYLIEFATLLGPNLHTMAICQPTVPLLAAISIMSKNKDPNTPASMILIGGPVDARQNPTDVNRLATSKSLAWFCKMMTTTVPMNYPGYGRKVYPGFLQLMAFISLNIPRHINSHLDLLEALLKKDIPAANHNMKFYDDYLAPMDMTAEFYLQTIEEVFKEFALAKDEFISRDRKVHLKDIKNCALLGIEGELDNIAAVGQTKAALDLCVNIPESMKEYYLQHGAGHYGTFSGSRFRQYIVPVMKDFIYKYDHHHNKNDDNHKSADKKPVPKKATVKKTPIKKPVAKIASNEKAVIIKDKKLSPPKTTIHKKTSTKKKLSPKKEEKEK